MQGFIISRLLQSVLVVLGVSLVVFMILRLSGDPSYLMLPPEATEADRIRFRQDLGLDQPLYTQYGRFLVQMAQGDFGRSLYYKQPALPVVLDRLPATIQLTVAALLVTIVVAIPAGIICALNRNSAYDNLTMLECWSASRCRSSGWVSC